MSVSEQKQAMSESAPAAMTEEQRRRALDAEIATRLMGWTFFPRRDPSFQWERSKEEANRKGCFVYGFNGPPHYSTDVKYSAEVEEEIARRGLGAEYARRLAMTVIGVWSIPMEYDEMFALLRATPEMRCRAALSCLPAAPTNPKDGTP